MDVILQIVDIVVKPDYRLLGQVRRHLSQVNDTLELLAVDLLDVTDQEVRLDIKDHCIWIRLVEFQHVKLTREATLDPEADIPLLILLLEDLVTFLDVRLSFISTCEVFPLE